MKLKIKYLPFLILLFVKINFCKGQINLVQNPSFENIVQCPTTNNNITDCANWLNFGNTPDYYNGCGSFGVNVPNAQTGYQNANSGVGMVGIVTWYNPMTSPNGREFFGALLTNTLQIGTKYFMSFFINYSGYLTGWRQVSSNKTGLRFSTVPSNSTNISPINNFAHLYTNTVCNDTVNWLKISGSFTCDSLYKYIIIGNFFDDSNTDTTSMGGLTFGGMAAYYYIDDVCVSTDSLYNLNWITDVKKEKKQIKHVSIYPNPSSGEIYFSNLDSDITYQITLNDNIGILKEEIELKNKNFIDIKDLPNGIYYLKIQNSEYYEIKKIIVYNP